MPTWLFPLPTYGNSPAGLPVPAPSPGVAVHRKGKAASHAKDGPPAPTAEDPARAGRTHARKKRRGRRNRCAPAADVITTGVPHPEPGGSGMHPKDERCKVKGEEPKEGTGIMGVRTTEEKGPAQRDGRGHDDNDESACPCGPCDNTAGSTGGANDDASRSNALALVSDGDGRLWFGQMEAMPLLDAKRRADSPVRGIGLGSDALCRPEVDPCRGVRGQADAKRPAPAGSLVREPCAVLRCSCCCREVDPRRRHTVVTVDETVSLFWRSVTPDPSLAGLLFGLVRGVRVAVDHGSVCHVPVLLIPDPGTYDGPAPAHPHPSPTPCGPTGRGHADSGSADRDPAPTVRCPHPDGQREPTPCPPSLSVRHVRSPPRNRMGEGGIAPARTDRAVWLPSPSPLPSGHVVGVSAEAVPPVGGVPERPSDDRRRPRRTIGKEAVLPARAGSQSETDETAGANRDRARALRLHRAWRFWTHSLCDEGQDYSSSRRPLGSGPVTCVHDLWTHLNHLPPPSAYFVQVEDERARSVCKGAAAAHHPTTTALSGIKGWAVFEEGVHPDWEDARNVTGCTLMFTVAASRATDDLWLMAVLDLVGETLPCADHVTGVRVWDRGRNHRLEVWLATRDRAVVLQARTWIETGVIADAGARLLRTQEQSHSTARKARKHGASICGSLTSRGQASPANNNNKNSSSTTTVVTPLDASSSSFSRLSNACPARQSANSGGALRSRQCPFPPRPSLLSTPFSFSDRYL